MPSHSPARPTPSLPVGELVEFGQTPHHQIGEMDKDHRDIANALRQMHDAFARHSPGLDLYRSHANVLLESICGHFYREAKAMNLAGYDRIGEHLKAHAELCGQVHDALDACSSDDAAALSAIPATVMSWLNGHIITDDQDYARHLQANMIDSRLTMQLNVEAEMTQFACDETCRKLSANCRKKR